jgi:hypothetical protein
MGGCPLITDEIPIQTQQTTTGNGQRTAERMARGGHGLPKVILGPAMPDPSTPCGGPPLGWAEKAYRVSSRLVPCGHLLPLWTPHAVRLCMINSVIDKESKEANIFGTEVLVVATAGALWATYPSGWMSPTTWATSPGRDAVARSNKIIQKSF